MPLSFLSRIESFKKEGGVQESKKKNVTKIDAPVKTMEYLIHVIMFPVSDPLSPGMAPN